MPAPTQPFASGKLVAYIPWPRYGISPKSPPTLPPKSLEYLRNHLSPTFEITKTHYDKTEHVILNFFWLPHHHQP